MLNKEQIFLKFLILLVKIGYKTKEKQRLRSNFNDGSALLLYPDFRRNF